MADPRRAITIYSTVATIEADRGEKLARYAVPLDRPHLFQWVPDDTTTADSVNVLTHTGGYTGRFKRVRLYDRGSDLGDATTTVYVSGKKVRLLPVSTLTASRTVTLGTTNAVAGDDIWIVSEDRSSYVLSVVNGGTGAGTLAATQGPGWVHCQFNGTNWFRVAFGGGAVAGGDVATQAAWYIDPSSGSDANDGAVATPLRTMAEFTRRVRGRTLLASTITVTAVGTLSEAVDFDVMLGDTVALTLLGSRSSSLLSGTLTAVQNVVEASGTISTITDSAIATSWTSSLGSNLNCLVRVALGAGSYAHMWIAKDLGSKTARVSDPMNPATFTSASLSTSLAYTTHTLTRIGNANVTFNAKVGHASYILIQDCELGSAGTHSVEFNDGNYTLISCAVNGADFFGTRNMASLNCKFTDGYRAHNGAYAQDYSGLLFSASSPPASRRSAELNLNATLVQGSALVSRGTISVSSGTWAAVYDPAVAANANGVEVLSGGHLKVVGRLFGTTTTTGTNAGVWVDATGRVSFNSSKPLAITGATNDTLIGGTSKSYATLGSTGFLNTNNGAVIGATDFARG
jgi:hypothetical protein